MKIAVCEDNQVEAEEIARLLRAWASAKGISLSICWYPTAEAFWFAFAEETFDALFLDIQMPGEDGVTLARKLRGRGETLPLVFVTGRDDFVLEGYDVEALHYLLKPVREEKVAQCMEKICRKQEQEQPVVLLQTENGVLKIRQRDIIKVEVFGRECIYTMTDGIYRTAQSMREAQAALPPECFVCCHRGILVNLQQVESINHSQVILAGGVTAPVSRRRYGALNEAFIQYFMP